MKCINIPKKSGGKRTIYIQGPTEKRKYRYLGYQLSEFYDQHGNGVAHGFVEGRSPISNARQHVNKQYTLSIDLENFFDTITSEHLNRVGVPFTIALTVCYKGSIKQGLSSSPSASNCAAILLDKDVVDLLNVSYESTVYTRYADDLIFSSDNLKSLLNLKDTVIDLIKHHDFIVNSKKIRVQSSHFGRRYITGIAVDNEIHAPRKQKRILRAMKYNLTKLKRLLFFLWWINCPTIFAFLLEINRKNIARFMGLNEWCKLKPPTKSLGGKLFSTYVHVETAKAFK